MRKAAVIGAGFISEMHAQGYKALADTALRAVCDTDAERASALSGKYGGTVYTDVREMLEKERPELVSICLPTFLHAEYTCLALRAGAHVLCEKPMALTLSDAERMARAAREAGRVLMIGQVVRFWPEYAILREEMRRMGAPCCISTERVQHTARGGARQAPNVNGGALYDLFIHDLDYVLSLRDDLPRVLYAHGLRGPEGSWRRVQAGLQYADGLFARLEASNLMPAGYPFHAAFRAEYPRAVLEYSFRTAGNIGVGIAAEGTLTRYENGLATPLPVRQDAQEQAFRDEIRAFSQGALRGCSPIPPEDSLRVLRMVRAIQDTLEAQRGFNV